jgi:tRNA threonylcarbamoyladenosine biosynthesis protein TsaB
MKKKDPLKNGQKAKNADSKSQGLILALETSGRTGSIAIGNMRQMLAEIEFSGQMRHSAELFPTIDTLLTRADKNPHDIVEIYISVGPGSFTGLRIAVAFAKTMNLATSAKIVALDTLDVIAANVIPILPDSAAGNSSFNKVAVILDAKRGQFFTAVYENDGGWQKILPDCLMTAEEFVQKFANQAPIWLLGEGLVYYKDKFKADGIFFFDEHLWTPKASNVYKLGREKVRSAAKVSPESRPFVTTADADPYEDAMQLKPIYLRRAIEKEE